MTNPHDDDYGGFPEPTDDELWNQLEHANDQNKIMIFAQLATNRRSSNEWNEAIALYEKALDLAEKAAYLPEKYDLICNIARCHSNAGRWHEAFDLMQKHEPDAIASLENAERASFFRMKGFLYRDKRMAI